MTDIASLNIRINTLEAKVAKQDLDRLTGAGQKAEHQMGTMSKAAARLGAALAAAVSIQKISAYIKEATLLNARYETLGVVLNQVGKNAGLSAKQVNEYSNQIRESGIQMDTARQVTIRMIQAQIDMSKASQLARIAQDAAVLGNINSSEALERMIHGIQSAQIEVMKGIGLNVNFENSYKALAKQLGVNKDSLTEQQKMQARVNETMEVAKAIAGSYEASMTTAGKQLASMKRHTDELKISTGELFNKAFTNSIWITTETLKGLNAEFASMKASGELDAWAARINTALYLVLDTISIIARTFTLAGKSAAAAFALMNMLAWDLTDVLINGPIKALQNIIDMYNAIPMMPDIEMPRSITSFGKTIGDEADLARRTLKAASEDLIAFFKDADVLPSTKIKEHIKLIKELEKAADETYDLDFDNYQDGLNTNIKLTKEELAALEKKKKITLDFLDAYKKATLSAFEYAIYQLNKEYDYYEKYIDDKVKLEEWYSARMQEIHIQRVDDALSLYFGEIDHLEEDYDKKLKAAEAFEEEIYALQFTSKENEIRLKEEALEAYSELEFAKVEVVAAAQADIYKTIHDQISALSETTFDGTSFGNELADGINEAVISMNDLNKMYEKQAKVQADLISLREKANTTEDIEERTKMLEGIKKVEAQLIEDQVSGYRQMFGTTAKLFKENSKERQIMHNAELAFAAIEIGMNLQKAISNAVVAVTSAGGGDPYTAIPRVIAMAALMGGILSQIGGSISAGGGGSAVPVKAENMTGTVLGYSGQASASLANIESFFEDMHIDEYTELQGIHDEMKSLNRNISGLVSNIFRSGMGFAPGDMGINTDFKISPAEKLIDNIFNIPSIPILDFVVGFVGKTIGKVVGKIFGGSVTTTVESQGITTVGGISIDDLMGGSSIGTLQYADIKKKKDGGWFRSDKTSYYTEYQAVGEDVDRLFTDIFTSVGKTFVDLAEIVGQDAMTVKDYVFEIGKIDLKNLTDADEISEALEAAFSGISDKAAADLFEEVVGQYQAVGEGMMETVVRVASEKIIVLDTVSKLGNAFEDADMPALAIEFSQSLLDIAGGLENFMETTGNYYNKFFSDEEKHTDITKSLEKAFTNLDIDFPDSRDMFRGIVEGIDIATESGQKAFVAMMRLSDSADKYYSYIEAAEKKRDELKNTYLDYLQKEIDIRQTAFDNAKNVLEEYIAGEERLIDARRQAAKSIDDFINGLMGSKQVPVQSLEFFEKRYAQLLSDAQTAGPDDIGNAVSALTSFTSQYLDFAGAYGGQDYNTLFNSVVSDLESVGADQLDQADVQTRELRDIKDLIGDTDGKLFDLNEAVQSFVDAKIGLDESAWMVQELNSLASIDSNLLLLYDAQRAYYGKVDTSKEPQIPIPEMDYVQYLYSTIGRSGFGSDMNQIDPEGYQFWSKASKTMSPEELSKAFYNVVAEYIAQNPDDPYTQFVSPYMGYADGGIISGPTSGYQLPGATFHGTEAIVPLKNGSIPVDIRSGNQDIKVVVKIGNRELKDITTEIIRTDPEAQGQIRRVANG